MQIKFPDRLERASVFVRISDSVEPIMLNSFCQTPVLVLGLEVVFVLSLAQEEVEQQEQDLGLQCQLH